MLPAMWSFWAGSLTQAVVALAFVTIVTYGYNAQSRWKLRNVPGPPPAWLVGNLRELRARNGIHLMLESWYRQYGPLYKFFLGRAPIVVVTGQHSYYHNWQSCAQSNERIIPRMVLLTMLTRALAEPELLKQIFTKSFMKFHDRPELQMRVNEGNEITA